MRHGVGDDAGAASAAIAAFPAAWRWRWETVDESVADTWREFAAPVWVDDDQLTTSMENIKYWRPIDEPDVPAEQLKGHM